MFDLACAVAKFLFVPILAVSSLSEMSYCGHERKLVLVPFPFLIGFFMAGVLADTAIELSVGVKVCSISGSVDSFALRNELLILLDNVLGHRKESVRGI